MCRAHSTTLQPPTLIHPQATQATSLQAISALDGTATALMASQTLPWKTGWIAGVTGQKSTSTGVPGTLQPLKTYTCPQHTSSSVENTCARGRVRDGLDTSRRRHKADTCKALSPNVHGLHRVVHRLQDGCQEQGRRAFRPQIS